MINKMNPILLILIIIVIIVIILVFAYFLLYGGSNNPLNVKASAVNGAIDISWNSVGEGYTYIVRIKNKNTGKTDEIPTNQTSLKYNTEMCNDYEITVSSKIGTCESLQSTPINVSIKLATPTLAEVRTYPTGIYLKWNAVPGAIYHIGLGNKSREYTESYSPGNVSEFLAKTKLCGNIYGAIRIINPCLTEFSQEFEVVISPKIPQNIQAKNIF